LTTGFIIATRGASAFAGRNSSRVTCRSQRKSPIHVRWLDSAKEAKVTDLQQAPSSIVWSPDGKWIGYVSRSFESGLAPRMPEKPAGGDVGRLRDHRHKTAVAADGQGLVQPGYSHVFVVPATGGTPKQITSGGL